MKRWNRRAENLLQRAEKWAAVADVLGGAPYPRDELTEAWKLVLFNQFHDTLGGTSIAPRVRGQPRPVRARVAAANAFNRAVQTISRRIDIPSEPELRPIVVFNAPAAASRRRRVRVHVAAGRRCADDRRDRHASPSAGDPPRRR